MMSNTTYLSTAEAKAQWGDEYPTEMYGYVQKVIDYFAAQDFEQVFSELRLDISFITGEEGAMGTADIAGVKGTQLTVGDLKYGMGVRVEAEENEQLVIYGAAALRQLDVLGDIETVRLVIIQPRLDSITEWVLTINQLSTILESLTTKAKRILTAKGGDRLSATPGKKQCQFCRAKLSNCSEFRDAPLTTIIETPKTESGYLQRIQESESNIHTTSDAKLADYMDALELIESWCSGVKKELLARLGQDRFTDPRWKLVQGRPGNRIIPNKEDLIDIAKEHGLRHDELYEQELMSPAKLEKIHKKGNPLFWAKVEGLMVRTEGKPMLAPKEDKRPALNLELDFSIIDDEYTDSAIGLTVESKT